jgi:WD40 repeat protein
MGEHGNSVRIHETETFALRHSLNTGHILTSFVFAQHNRELVCATQDCKLLFFSLNKYEGVYLREIATVHRGMITSLDVSSNSGFLLTGGQDNMIKVWDYEAPKAHTEFF